MTNEEIRAMADTLAGMIETLDAIDNVEDDIAAEAITNAARELSVAVAHLDANLMV